jgi:hypothetical protein
VRCADQHSAGADLATKVQRKHHEPMMNALMHLMGGSEEPRVQSHAASAIVNFCEGLGDDDGGNIVGRYLRPLTDRLLVLLQGGNQLAVEAALTATSSIADGVGVRCEAHTLVSWLVCAVAVALCTSSLSPTSVVAVALRT